MRKTYICVIVSVLLAATVTAQEPEQKAEGSFAIGVKTTAPWHVAYQKFTGPYSGFPGAIDSLNLWVAKNGLVPLGFILTEFYNTPLEVDSTKLEWAIMLPVLEPSGGFPEETKGEATVKSLAQIQVVYTYHQGPYSDVGPTYQQLFMWVFQNGYQPAGPIREIYWSNPEVTPKEKLIAELQIPVTKK